MARLRGFFLLLFLTVAQTALADDRLVRLHAPPDLVASGLFRHILPRFTLKTQIRVELVEAAAGADMVLGGDGVPVFAGIGRAWRMATPGAGHLGTDRLAQWLLSEVGRNTVQGFAPEGVALFVPPADAGAAQEVVAPDGDAALGHQISLAKCTRCHAVDAATHWSSLGSTPSFAVVRSLSDWQQRFETFYVLKPHPAFTQVAGVTPPFAIDRPPPIVPLEISVGDLEAIVAYVAAMKAADLGRPLDHQ